MERARDLPGFSGAVLRHEARELVIFGVGDPPEALVAIMREAPPTIRVTWVSAPYSFAELTDEMLRIMAEQRLRLNSGSARHDGTGIDFTTTDRALLDADDPRMALGARYPVTIEYGQPPVTHGGTRA